MSVPETPPVAEVPQHAGPWRLIAAICASVAVVAVAVAAFALVRDDGRGDVSTTGPAAGWMMGSMGPMMGSMMGGDPSAMHDACIEAMDTEQPGWGGMMNGPMMGR